MSISVASVAAVAAFALPEGNPVRVAVVLGFLLVCPGMAIVRPLRLVGGGTQLAVAFAVSATIETMLSLALVYLHLWSPGGLLAVLGAACLAAGVLELRRSPSGQAETTPSLEALR
jgi:hypothetical protein